ncbi:hypothetical protein DFH94DRAFT_725099 [Russula ochroleuca]|uniref:Uncharacterized protein n=1 Tax=Russula ochroleuca TaxID=152965 RepID=A0A9P5TC00_9AGAM|nr:hypothetical protein DFH94DRAFT_725099 [Russula ochroleuca]
MPLMIGRSPNGVVMWGFVLRPLIGYSLYSTANVQLYDMLKRAFYITSHLPPPLKLNQTLLTSSPPTSFPPIYLFPIFRALSVTSTHYLSHSYFQMGLLTGIALGAVGAATGVAVTPFVAPVLLGIVGFSAAGPVAGSIAAGMQAGIGNVVVGSLFATAQSLAMGGTVPAVVSAAGGMGAGAAAAVAAVLI